MLGIDGESRAVNDSQVSGNLNAVLIGQAANEFFDAIARGDQPSIADFANKYPAIAEHIRRTFPALLVIGDASSADATMERTLDVSARRTLGDFRLIREIGRGGMGTVFEAEQLSMGRHVALKVLPFAALAHEKSLQRFRNEVRAAAALDHPNIVSVYSVGEERGIHYFAMQLIRGRTLADLIAQLHGNPPPSEEKDANAATLDWTGNQPPSTVRDAQARFSTARDSRQATEHFRMAARLGIQAAEALQHAHDQGVLHRDVKPSNLMLDVEGDLFVADFGLARIEADAGMTMTGDILGTLRYMAPEQALAKRVVVDQRADVYSIGATLYELLTLEPAFSETDRSELLKQIAFEDPTPLRKRDRRIPLDLETIVLKAMAKNPAERYQTAQGLADDLCAFLASKPIKAKPPTVSARLLKLSRRHPGVALAFASALVVTTIVSTMSATMILVARNKEIEQRRLADTNAMRAQEISNFLVEAFLSPDPTRDGRTITIAEVLDRWNDRLSQKFADDPLTKAELARNLSKAYSGLGLYGKAIPLLEDAYKLRSTALGLEHVDSIQSALELGLVLAEDQREGDSIRVQEEALKISERALGRTHVRSINLMNNLASVYLDTGQVNKAIPLFEQAVELEGDKKGLAHPDVIAMKGNLGQAYVSAGRVEEGLPLVEERLRGAIELYGPVHYHTLKAMVALSAAYWSVQRHDESVALLEKVMQLRQSKLGLDNPQTLQAAFALAIRYRELAKPKEATALLEDCLQLDKAGPAHPFNQNVKCQLARSKFLARDSAEAIELLDNVLAHQPNHLLALRLATQILCLTRDEKVRDPLRGVQLAEKACELTNFQRRDQILLLFMAYGRAGDYESATKLTERYNKEPLTELEVRTLFDNVPYPVPSDINL